jgi:predicted N-acyltransferase
MTLLRLLVGEMVRYASRKKISLLGVKDAAGDKIGLWQACLHDFQQLPGLPTGMLDLPYNRFEDYLGSLSRATRKDMKRKLRAAASIRIERRVSIDDLLPRIVALYHETVDRSELQMERLPGAYFSQLLDSMRGQASCVLYWHDERLVAINLVLEDQTRLIDKFIGMDYEFVRSYSLYFVSWLANVRYCIERGISVYQAGQGCYAPKLRLGCRLQPNWYFFRHRNPIVNNLLKTLSAFVRVDRFDNDLRTVYGTMK